MKMKMKKTNMITTTAALVVLILLARVPPAAAQSGVMVTGGGTGTFNADLDGDGDVDGSHFGFGVIIRPNGSARGHFLCQMAGNADFLGLKLMLVEGRVSSGTINPDGSATFNGGGSVNLANGTVFRGIPFTVTVTPGGRFVGSLRLTVIGVFDGVPGDTFLGNGNYDLPVELVNSGLISIH